MVMQHEGVTNAMSNALLTKLASGYYTEKAPRPKLPAPPDLLTLLTLDVPAEEWDDALAQRQALIEERRASSGQRLEQWKADCAELAQARGVEFIEDLAAHCGSRSMAEKCLAFALAEQQRSVDTATSDTDDEAAVAPLDDADTLALAVRLAEHFTPAQAS